MAKGDFGGKRNTNGFDKNKHNINRNGSNRKVWASINKRLEESGVEPVKKETYYDTVSRIMNMTEAELSDLESDTTVPQWLRWLINDLTNQKIRSKIMSEYRDWMFGRASQRIESTEIQMPVVRIINPTNEGIEE